MADAIDIITRLLDGEIITQASDWYTMREARLHLRPYSKAAAASGGRQRGNADWRQARRALRSRHAVRDGGEPNGYDTLDYNWELACSERRRRAAPWTAATIG